MDQFKNSDAQTQKILSHLVDFPFPSDDSAAPLALLARCPAAASTPLVHAPLLAERASVAHVHIKDERGRMGLGSFKALGAAYVIAHDAQNGDVKGHTYVTASAGNHGLSVAAGAAAFGAHAVVFLADTVPESFARRLQAHGAEVRRQGAIYEEAMAAAAQAATDQSWRLLSDSSWPGYTARPHRLMEGYLALMQEAIDQIGTPPTHIFLQAGVGGLAAACAVLARKAWGTAPKIIVVEPEVAPALFASVKQGEPAVTRGPASEMGRLDCKEPSLIALKGLARDADIFMTISEAEGAAGHHACVAAGLASTPSGAAGVAGLLAATSQRDAFDLNQNARVLVILSEEPTSLPQFPAREDQYGTSLHP